MSEDRGRKVQGDEVLPEASTSGVNLKLIYSLIALAIFGALAIAFLIVLPFYHRH